MPCRCKELIKVLENIAPANLAEDWDNIGLTYGDPESEIIRIMVTLDVTNDVVLEAARENVQMIISHHPILLHRINKLEYQQPEVQIIKSLIQNNICLYVMHTNLDAARGGVNDSLACALDLKGVSILRKVESQDYLKLVVFAPAEHTQTLLDALFESGAGQIGAYSRCSFTVDGTGTFFPGQGTNPFVGKIGALNKTKEARIETIIPSNRAEAAMTAIKRVHPYEEPAYDLCPVRIPNSNEGMGRIGRLEHPMKMKEFCRLVKSKLGSSCIISSGHDDEPVTTIAVCGGSGSDFIDVAHSKGADVLVTGDMKHHNWLYAKAQGMKVVDAGHYYTERVVVRPLIARLHRDVNELKYSVAIVESKIDTGFTRIF